MKQAIAEFPSIETIKNPELKLMLEILYYRFEFAFDIRKALGEKKGSEGRTGWLDAAEAVLELAKPLAASIEIDYNRYPSAKNFEFNENPTSYGWGYAYPSTTLHFWKRELDMVRNSNYCPFY